MVIEKWILTDTYPIPKKKLIVEELYGDKQYVLSEYSPHKEGPIFTRCDLHPRWSFDGKLIFFDSTHGGNRSVYFIDLTKSISNYPIY
jgi:Tol biopolymer transport system component